MSENSSRENQNDIELTILMPCLNEAETLEVCIKKAFHFLEEYHVNGEVLIADNGSTDGSQEIARRCGYLDQSYFGYCFKKYYGVSPAKMRQESEQRGAGA